MQLATILKLSPLLLAVLAQAGHNCKCQDSNGQYNGFTKSCCFDQRGGDVLSDITYHDDQVHQCTSASNHLDSGAFVTCCQGHGVGGAYCWN
ncbi:hypothetical protein AB5N19_14106 [Seiridium cardinale]